jgi:hypothetical protein
MFKIINFQIKRIFNVPKKTNPKNHREPDLQKPETQKTALAAKQKKSQKT